jgi:hypothetical protein
MYQQCVVFGHQQCSSGLGSRNSTYCTLQHAQLEIVCRTAERANSAKKITEHPTYSATVQLFSYMALEDLMNQVQLKQSLLVSHSLW